MQELLKLPDAPRPIYEDAPLALVVAEIRFPAVIDILHTDNLGRFQRAIRKDYPIAQESENFELEIEIAQKTEVRSRNLPRKVMFTDQSQDWKVILGEGSLALQSRAYRHFEQFRERLEKLVEAVEPLVSPSFMTRVGLRYIDEFRPLAPHAEVVIREELLGLLAPGPLQSFAKTCVQQATLEVDEYNKITIRHGRLPQGSVIRSPRLQTESLQQPFYVLDVDAFGEFPIDKAQTLDWLHVRQLLDDYHEVQHRLFHFFLNPAFESSLQQETSDA